MNDLNKEEIAQEVPVQEQPKITFEYLIDSPSKIFLTNDESLYKRLIENNQSIYMFGPEFNKSSNTENVLQIKIQDYHLVQILLDKKPQVKGDGFKPMLVDVATHELLTQMKEMTGVSMTILLEAAVKFASKRLGVQ